MEESRLPSFLWLRGNDSLLAVLGGWCDPCSPSHGLVASSWSDKQHFHLVVAPVQPSLGHGEKKRMSGFKPMHMALESGRHLGELTPCLHCSSCWPLTASKAGKEVS